MPVALLCYPEGTVGASEIFSRFKKLHIESYPSGNLEFAKSLQPEILIASTRLIVDSKAVEKFPSVRIFATVSSGVDHVNFSDLKKAGKIFLNSPGCNAGSVAEYCWVSLLYFFSLEELKSKKVGLVGFGNTGKAFGKILSYFGISFVYHDPYFKEFSSSLDAVYQCPILSFHVPLTKSGPYPTEAMFQKKHVTALKPETLVLNTSRGEVWEKLAYQEILSRSDIMKVIDVYSEEPPKKELELFLNSTRSIFTPHIAGYSQLGRLTGTYRLAEKLAILYGEEPLPKIQKFMIFSSDLKTEFFLSEEDRQLREAWSKQDWEYFERRRNHYPIRLDMGLIEV
ncbi:phosphoglycerate dehydrogenase [Leptospira perolatii]|uniref:Phosphoglycerate dehydrogenase n=1 Tax=Leptospira perolatii TaxID=2023191 RepID=A0A2M9ZSW5_9LEPT|nr:NAD(P)-dependent oxidoreductase [Leptospira perolatii]PJZ68791.1 phosphoglycerate dehydrogenase [Leptospira perolatii]PJZ75146.1 phosphoglycerate dehydrogenase [Leptospira perolatii]